MDGTLDVTTAVGTTEMYLIVAAVPLHFRGHQTYSYRVIAYNADGASNPSKTDHVSIPPRMKHDKPKNEDHDDDRNETEGKNHRNKATKLLELLGKWLKKAKDRS